MQTAGFEEIPADSSPVAHPLRPSLLSSSQCGFAVPTAWPKLAHCCGRCFTCQHLWELILFPRVPWFLLAMHLKQPFISGIHNLRVPDSGKEPEDHVHRQLPDVSKACLEPLCLLFPVCSLRQAWLVRMSSLDWGCGIPFRPSSALGWPHLC